MKLSTMPVDLSRLTEGWLELESDPGLFTLLLEDFGVQGIQIDEIYDLQKPIEGPVYGFIFLFKWIEERRSRRKFLSAEECFIQNEDIVNSMFFAQQMVPNSCATHALLSVLLNCDFISVGQTLKAFKEYTKNMSPENKGFAIGNSPELARAHNSHAKPGPQQLSEKSHGHSSSGRKMDAFHFVSYVPIKGHLFELDGLRSYPLDHGPWAEGQDWTEKFRHVITERLGIATRGEPYHDIRFNLMAVVPDRRTAYESKLKTLKTNKKIVMVALQQLIRQTQPELLQRNDLTSFESDANGETGDQDHESLPQKLPAALDSHNYAKSPLIGCSQNSASFAKASKIKQSDSETSSCDEGDVENLKNANPTCNPCNVTPLKQLSVKTSSDFLTPLSIQTHLSPTYSTTSTDTSSEVGSAFNSPAASRDIQQASPSCSSKTQEKRSSGDFSDINKFVCIRVTSDKAAENIGATDQNELEKSNKSDRKDDGNAAGDPTSEKYDQVKGVAHRRNELIRREEELVEPHKFAPKDLLALLKTLEDEINGCEVNLKDEVEKRRRFKIDDSRRTHNYDQFITTFLLMLSEQNKLTGLIKQNCVGKRRQGMHTGQLSRVRKPDKRKRKRSRKKK